MDHRAIGVASEVRDLSRDLLYFAERLNLNPEAGLQIYQQGIEPRLRQARERLAACCGSPERILPQQETATKFGERKQK